MAVSCVTISHSPRPTLVVMVKEPRPGRVKSRLARDIGTIPALWWYRHQTRRLLRTLRDPSWNMALAVTPDRAARSTIWPADLPRLPQGPGDLGQRMARLLTGLGSGPVVLIGSDIPGITRAHIRRAFHALAGADAVFGPATDGGYWLVGLRQVRATPPAFLRNVRWSGPHTLSDSMTTCEHLRVVTTDPLDDIDTGGDLRRYESARRQARTVLGAPA